MGLRVWTIGHSTRTPEAFVEILARHGIRMLVDVRTVPKSRHVPWTAIDRLPQVLSRAGIGYAHLQSLGGLRKPRKDSPNAAWRNLSFRGYADHMQSRDFERGVEELMGLAAHVPTAIMCAEAVPWRCHRSLVADALTVRGAEVFHIMDGEAKPHALTSFAKVEGDRVTYPPGGPSQTRLGGAADGDAAEAADVDEDENGAEGENEAEDGR